MNPFYFQCNLLPCAPITTINADACFTNDIGVDKFRAQAARMDPHQLFEKIGVSQRPAMLDLLYCPRRLIYRLPRVKGFKACK